MIIGDESNDIEEFKEGDCVILNHLLEGTVEYISKMGFAEVFFKTDCGGRVQEPDAVHVRRRAAENQFQLLWTLGGSCSGQVSHGKSCGQTGGRMLH